jgi:hypothetical protein
MYLRKSPYMHFTRFTRRPFYVVSPYPRWLEKLRCEYCQSLGNVSPQCLMLRGSFKCHGQIACGSPVLHACRCILAERSPPKMGRSIGPRNPLASASDQRRSCARVSDEAFDCMGRCGVAHCFIVALASRRHSDSRADASYKRLLLGLPVS